MRDERGKLTLSSDQIRGIAACVVALRDVPSEGRMDCLVVICKSIMEERLNWVLFPEDNELVSPKRKVGRET